MRENPYLIRMDIEEDCNYSTYNATSGIYYRQFNWPVLGAMKDVTLVEPTVTIRGRMHADDESRLQVLANALARDFKA